IGGDVVRVKLRKMMLAFEFRVPRPSLSDLLKQQVPAGVAAILLGRLGAEETERILRQSPSLETPAAGVSTGTTHPRTEGGQQGLHRRLAVHGGQQVRTDPVYLYQRKGI